MGDLTARCSDPGTAVSRLWDVMASTVQMSSGDGSLSAEHHDLSGSLIAPPSAGCLAACVLNAGDIRLQEE
jgi:uncharacterized membrane protein YebE (DUF533 family)